jgi:hypothetical protein
MTHNFDVDGSDLWVAAKEGIFQLVPSVSDARILQIGTNNVGGVGEVRVGRVGGKITFAAAIEPMHGTNVAIFTPPPADDASSLWQRRVIDPSLIDGHALACGDLLGIGRDQIVAGWRAMGKSRRKSGNQLYTPLANDLKGLAHNARGRQRHGLRRRLSR